MIINSDWEEFLQNEYTKNYFIKMRDALRREYKEHTIYPKYYEIFKALELSPLKDTKVFILGQDPYHEVNQANGLAFSVNDGVALPPSLRNIYKELYDDLGILNKTGDLDAWAKQGVLLLNSTLTVRKGYANSHKDIGWQIFTDKIIETLCKNKENVVYILWGAYARSKMHYINTSKNLVITSAHPSPLSAYRGFFGSRPFSKTNAYLKAHNIKEIDWRIK